MRTKRPSWYLPESAAIDEAVYRDRRRFLSRLGLGGALLAGGGLGLACSGTGAVRRADGAARDGRVAEGRPIDARPRGDGSWSERHRDLYPPRRNTAYEVKERPISPEARATRYNNFYEFTTDKGGVHRRVSAFQTYPWTVEIAGLVERPGRYDLDTLVRRFTLEERVYRFRCVEAWAMTVPWSGFPLAKLIAWVKPLSSARFLRFVSDVQKEGMPGLVPYYPWPYHEGLRMDEANNELAFIATGLYGKPLPKQNGAPIRLITPWKYGYKSAKSIVTIEFLAEQPPTFWNTLAPREYGFLSNVDPAVAHPRWSQATEQLIGSGDRVKTLPYNGYADIVATLYP